MRLYSILSVLLDYPDEDLKDHLDEIETLLDDEAGLAAPERDAIRNVVRWLKQTDLLDLQQHYVQTFDLTQDHSLHLTHHTHGESRERGPALIDLAEHYRAHGFEVTAGELPDFLPLVLEYVNTLDAVAARLFLHDVGDALKRLADNLARAASPYAPLAQVVEARGRFPAGEAMEVAGAATV